MEPDKPEINMMPTVPTDKPTVALEANPRLWRIREAIRKAESIEINDSDDQDRQLLLLGAQDLCDHNVQNNYRAYWLLSFELEVCR